MTTTFKYVRSPESYAIIDPREAQVFRDLEALHETWLAEDEGIFLYQYPEDRTMLQRLQAWWFLKRQESASSVDRNQIKPMSEPDWPRHWGTFKFL